MAGIDNSLTMKYVRSEMGIRNMNMQLQEIMKDKESVEKIKQAQTTTRASDKGVSNFIVTVLAHCLFAYARRLLQLI